MYQTWQQVEFLTFVEIGAIREDIEHGVERAARLVAGVQAIVHDGRGAGLPANALKAACSVIDWCYHGGDKPTWLAALQQHQRLFVHTSVFAEEMRARDAADTLGWPPIHMLDVDHPFGGEWLAEIEGEVGKAVKAGGDGDD